MPRGGARCDRQRLHRPDLAGPAARDVGRCLADEHDRTHRGNRQARLRPVSSKDPGSRPLSRIPDASASPSQKPGQTPDEGSEHGHRERLAGKQPPYLPGHRADGAEQSDLTLALLDEQRDHAGEDQRSDEQCDAAE